MTTADLQRLGLVPIADLLAEGALESSDALAASSVPVSILRTALGALLYSYARGGAGNGGGDAAGKDDRWWLGAGIEVKYGDGAVLRHDLVGWRRDRVPKLPEEMPVSVRPDWVCDIVTPGSRGADVIRLRRALHAAKVPHCWIVDTTQRVLSVYRWHKDGFLALQDLQAGERGTLEPFERIELDAAELFGGEG